ncbi:MAG TPA: hypothetical protein VHU40_10475, partial [Polyangia bacterium]|nr:hypothetical protein [Polyangia bacterium]
MHKAAGLLTLGLGVLAMTPVAAAKGPSGGGGCPEKGNGAAALWLAPLEPSVGRPLHVLGVAEDSLSDVEVALIGR